MSEDHDRISFGKWIARPQSIIALSAVVLSLSGLFIAIYEASLIRQAQRSSVWPHVEMGTSMTTRDGRPKVELWVRNVGVGPARIHAAAVSHRGEVLSGWSELVSRVDPASDGAPLTYSLMTGRVFPAAAEGETVFKPFVDEDQPNVHGLNAALIRAIRKQEVDVEVCYCSVYDECWTSRLQDLVLRLNPAATPTGPREVDDCDDQPRSAI